MIMVDTNIIIDLREEMGEWFDWSADTLSAAIAGGSVSVSAIVVGELAAGGDPLAEIESYLAATGLTIDLLSARAAYLAGLAHRAYRLAGGLRDKMLADFLIGGHAQSVGAALITRDARRYRSYFPDLTLITPDQTS
jgi:hypothetical protein